MSRDRGIESGRHGKMGAEGTRPLEISSSGTAFWRILAQNDKKGSEPARLQGDASLRLFGEFMLVTVMNPWHCATLVSNK